MFDWFRDPWSAAGHTHIYIYIYIYIHITLYKYVDDSTLFEICDRKYVCVIQESVGVAAS